MSRLQAPGHADWYVAPVHIAGRELPLKQVSFGDVLAAQAEGVEGPWWAAVWPAGRRLAEYVLEGPSLDGLRCLDLGTGSGIVGIALALKGARVTFSDLRPEALELAKENAVACGVHDFETLKLDWRVPPDRRFDRIYAADVVYEDELLGSLAHAFSMLLEPEGVAILSDPRRPQYPRFLEALADEGLDVVHLRRAEEDVLLQLRRRPQ